MNQRISIVLSLFLSICQIAKAQTEATPANTLFGNAASGKIGFMIAPSMGYTTIDNAGVAMFNLRGGIVLAKKLTVGGYYNASLNEFVPKSETVPGIYMDYRSGGLLAEYTLWSDKLLHLTFPLMIGIGEVEMDSPQGTVNFGEANFLRIEPGALLEVNLLPYVRLNAGLTYRHIGQMTYRNLTHQQISGLQGLFGLKIGLFR